MNLATNLLVANTLTAAAINNDEPGRIKKDSPADLVGIIEVEDGSLARGVPKFPPHSVEATLANFVSRARPIKDPKTGRYLKLHALTDNEVINAYTFMRNHYKDGAMSDQAKDSLNNFLLNAEKRTRFLFQELNKKNINGNEWWHLMNKSEYRLPSENTIPNPLTKAKAEYQKLMNSKAKADPNWRIKQDANNGAKIAIDDKFESSEQQAGHSGKVVEPRRFSPPVDAIAIKPGS